MAGLFLQHLPADSLIALVRDDSLSTGRPSSEFAARFRIEAMRSLTRAPARLCDRRRWTRLAN